MTLRNEILNRTVPTEPADIAGHRVEVRGMTVAGQREFLARVTSPGGDVNRDLFLPELVIATVFDPDTGAPLFEAADRDTILQLPAADLNDVQRVAMRLAGLSDRGDAVKPSSGTTGGGTS
jgi:hypothetical protein